MRTECIKKVKWGTAVALQFTIVLLSSCDGTERKTETQSPKTYRITHPAQANSAVIFIHGVMGDSRATWASPKHPDGWADIMTHDPQMPPVDSISVGFLSQPVSSASNIEEIAVRTLQSLRDDGVLNHYERIAIVAHSMGGLVVKRMLEILQSEDPKQVQKIKAVIFLSTPAHGSETAKIASWISENPQFRDMEPSDFNSFLQLLDNDWMTLLRKRTPKAPFPKAYCAYETKPTSTLKIVPRSKAQAGCDQTPIGFDLDHISIAKPNSNTDEIHKFVRARIIEAFDPNLVPQHVSVEIVRSNGQTVSADDYLGSGEQYFIRLTATRPTWFYVFNRDRSDVIERYFPSAAGGTQNQPLTALRIPQRESAYITLNDVVGTERFYIFASNKPDPALEKEAKEIASKKSKAELSVPELEGVIVKRGGHIDLTRLEHNGPTTLPLSIEGAAAIVSFEHR